MEIIRETLMNIERRLNEFFRNQVAYFSNENKQWVILSNVVDHGGGGHDAAKNKVVMYLANIQREVLISTFNRAKPLSEDRYATGTPPLYIDLFILFFANFYNANYKDGLSAISTTISFFQQNPVFNHQNLPDLDASIDKLAFEMTNLDLTELSHLMTMMGAKYLPSVYYKMRMIPFQADTIQATVPALRGLKTPAELDDSADMVPR